MTSSAEWKRRYSATFMNTFGVPSLALVRGEGVHVWDADGREYLDLLGGIAVNALGYAHPALTAAIEAQLQTIGHVSNFFTTPIQVTLGEKIAQIFKESGYSAPVRIFLANSGTEANEAAVKLTRLHKPGGRLLAFTHAFHGRTLGALSVTAKAVIREPFEPLPGNVEFVEPTVEALRQAFSDDVAGIFMEPIQGEAGVLPLDPAVMREARSLCDRFGALLVIDEVQTGIGRTGSWLASADTVKADVVTLAKALGGGFPISACVGVGAAGELFTPGSHGSTFGGNPLACAASAATLDQVGPLLGHVREVGEWLAGQLQDAGYAVRGKGLLRGVAVADAPVAVSALLDRGIIVNAPNPQTLRLAPPLTITDADLVPFIQAMRDLAPDQAMG
ncbi:MAG: acetylornithine transaminase [Ancrocorticia sp.]|jgi:acetylornithine/N-succinyldiaminopimelate aminotransferase|nr:acetylornithine transaminase [Ancrocorticia sp.]MCI2002905.1 acetylornithine transaminase [Ancrocorticia sp.]MCI2013271.1 acetylornithine transaminase [Ancrocorticia sp.]MCI2030242.1 acetylornithine transaminase [Ancrocorticia sp.]MCI2178997.1 acetylornithine transaminase [Ancrocorticia sp.]